jgi:hypothetical protein
MILVDKGRRKGWGHSEEGMVICIYKQEQQMFQEEKTLKLDHKREIGHWVPVAHACNPSYLEAEIRRPAMADRL